MRFVPLPAPHDGVLFRYFVTDQYVCAQYVGRPTALLAAGAAEPGMIEPGSAARRGLDGQGEHFRRSSYGQGMLRIDRFVRTRLQRRALPGVPQRCTTELIAWLDAHPGELHFAVDERFESVSGSRELLVARQHARECMFDGDFGFWGTRDDHAHSGPERWRCHADLLLDGYYRIRRSRNGGAESTPVSREDRVRTLRAYARHEMQELLDMARGISHHGRFTLSDPSVRLIEEHAAAIERVIEQAIAQEARTRGAHSKVVHFPTALDGR
jgi:hypothetical protein